MRNMHGYALSGFILHVPRKDEGSRGTREFVTHRKRKDRFVVTSIFKIPLPRSHSEITKSPLFFYFLFFFFRTFSNELLARIVTLSRTTIPVFFFYKETRKSSKIHEYIFPVRIFPPFQKNFAYLSRNKRYAGQLNNLGERLGATSNG